MARFIVGTGRCGSTLMSRMLAQSPRVCSLFEVFSGIDQFFRFRTDPVGGEELASRLAEDHPMLTMVLSRGYEVPEVAYPFDAPGARYGRSDPIPWNLAIAVARISEAPDALFDELLDFARRLPEQPLRLHYPQLLEWLTRRTGRELWVEKSGTSIEFAEELASFFPGARFVHLHRDGPETALSMREYSVLRLAVPVMNGLLGEVEYSHDGLVDFERRNAEAIDRTLASRPPAELFGRYWSGQVERGVPVLGRVDPAAVLEVRFEELVTRPAPVITEIARFLEIDPSDGWIERAAALVKGMPKARVPDLDAAERRALEEACRPGMELLGRI
ncbi:MAG: sulfotransferase [Myxococcota bacterium]|nr:sulfotransferase [Myxococcota bacterium]